MISKLKSDVLRREIDSDSLGFENTVNEVFPVRLERQTMEHRDLTGQLLHLILDDVNVASLGVLRHFLVVNFEQSVIVDGYHFD